MAYSYSKCTDCRINPCICMLFVYCTISKISKFFKNFHKILTFKIFKIFSIQNFQKLKKISKISLNFKTFKNFIRFQNFQIFLKISKFSKLITKNIYYYIIKGLLHEYWWILSLAIYHIALASSCNNPILSSFHPAISTCWLHKQNSYQSSCELSWTYQQWAGVITKFSQHLNDNSCEDDKSK